ncbi:hypothetical protein [Polyangium sp. 15x6]|uniref:hypothetical protein n=1 Tax=Polyangium sp. 15x6 TaxID=3042687 RepID=UPI00249AD422|nr:hypothetical protein [Polyangium sp. 15x6]MDI3287198.1 hypothetical protein [Polyangium sp. 15x6]
MRPSQAPLCLLPFALAGLLVACPRAAAAAPEESSDEQKQACADASEQGQELRDQGKLLAARGRFLACAAEACPPIVRKDCADWLADLDERTPSIVLEARGPEGQDLTDVRVLEGERELASSLDGKAIPLDPGEHRLRYEWPSAPPVEERIVLREGERRRRLSVRFAPAAPPPPKTPTPVAPPPRPLPLAPLVLGGVALAGAAAFTGLAVSAKSDYDHLDGTCAPRCTADLVDPVRTKLILANVSLGVSVVSLGVATFLWFTRPQAPPGKTPATAFAITPLPGGAAAFLGGTLPFDGSSRARVMAPITPP